MQVANGSTRDRRCRGDARAGCTASRQLVLGLVTGATDIYSRLMHTPLSLLRRPCLALLVVIGTLLVALPVAAGATRGQTAHARELALSARHLAATYKPARWNNAPKVQDSVATIFFNNDATSLAPLQLGLQSAFARLFQRSGPKPNPLIEGEAYVYDTEAHATAARTGYLDVFGADPTYTTQLAPVRAPAALGGQAAAYKGVVAFNDGTGSVAVYLIVWQRGLVVESVWVSYMPRQSLAAPIARHAAVAVDAVWRLTPQ